MIGLFGIIAHESILDKQQRNQSFSRMADDTDHEDFIIEVLSGRHYSIGLIKRAIGENKDLAMKAAGDNLFCAFCGYGKFSGEKRLYWADDMLDRAAEAFQKEGPEALTLIEGSFQCLILKDNEFLIVSDRFSSKNLFYHNDDGCFVFAPDVGRVVQSGLVPKVKNLDAAKQVLVSGFFLDDSTLAKGVMRFPYGSLLRCHVSRRLDLEIKRYWEVSEREGGADEVTPDLIAELNSKMKFAIDELAALTKRAVVPLSGGLDSRAIAYYVSKRQPLQTITYDLGDEVSISKKVCIALGGSRTYFSNEFIQSDDFKIELKRMVEEQRIHDVYILTLFLMSNIYFTLSD
jgi:asparagine synthetase B (glutamine-hydrolysing)